MIGAALAAILLFGAAHARASSTGDEAAAAYCAAPVRAERTVPALVPPSLAEAFLRRFALNVPVSEAGHAGYVRCDGPIVLGCAVGADLPCGKADTRRSLPAADEWCRANGNPAVLPRVAIGSGSLFEWHCVEGHAVLTRQTLHVDPQGYVAEYWRPLAP